MSATGEHDSSMADAQWNIANRLEEAVDALERIAVAIEKLVQPVEPVESAETLGMTQEQYESWVKHGRPVPA